MTVLRNTRKRMKTMAKDEITIRGNFTVSGHPAFKNFKQPLKMMKLSYRKKVTEELGIQEMESLI